MGSGWVGNRSWSRRRIRLSGDEVAAMKGKKPALGWWDQPATTGGTTTENTSSA